jgi:sugar lactone lactonase YvrE
MHPTDFRQLGSPADILGESPVWSEEDASFYWVDIRGPLIRRWTPGRDRVDAWQAPSLVGCIVPRRSGGLVVGLADRVAYFSPRSGAFSPAFDLPRLTGEQRLNDGKCDPLGRFWVGSMNIVTREPDGRLYRIDPDGTVHIMLEGLAVPNSLSWNIAGDSMYFSQTRDRRLLRFPFDADSGAIGEPSLIAETAEPGTPDGATVDTQDGLWVAEFGNGRLTRIGMREASLIHVDLPCRYPTSCAFGGHDMRTLLVTSASVRLSDEERAAAPHEGGAFVAEADHAGIPPHLFGT